MLVTITHYAPDHSMPVRHMTADSFADGLALVRAMKVPRNNLGVHPIMHVADQAGGFRVTLGEDKAGRAVWSIGFAPDGIYKSLWCRAGERAGVRYASHRRGYQASERAMSKLAADIEATMLARELAA